MTHEISGQYIMRCKHKLVSRQRPAGNRDDGGRSSCSSAHDGVGRLEQLGGLGEREPERFSPLGEVRRPTSATALPPFRRSVDRERSRRPHFVSRGQATPRPSSMTSIFAKVSRSLREQRKTSTTAISAVRSRSYWRRSPAKRSAACRLPDRSLAHHRDLTDLLFRMPLATAASGPMLVTSRRLSFSEDRLGAYVGNQQSPFER